MRTFQQINDEINNITKLKEVYKNIGVILLESQDLDRVDTTRQLANNDRAIRRMEKKIDKLNKELDIIPNIII